jgi:hypothetical protein
MQHYKFKAYIKELGKVYDVLSLHAPFPDEGFHRVFINKPVEEGEVKNYRIEGVDNHLMMYSGKKTDEGIEIYSGHIIEYDRERENKYIRERGVVYLDMGQFHVYGDSIKWIKDIKVLGTIYENPELITQ